MNQYDDLSRDELVQKLQDLQRALEKSMNGIMVIAPDGMITFVNKEGARLNGYAPGDLLGKNVSLFFEGRDDFTLDGLFAKTKENGEIRIEAPATRKDGRHVMLSMNISVLKNENDELTGYLAVAQDITKQKEREKELENKNAELTKTNDLMVGRELKMVEMKEELKKLKPKEE
ncbi:PAS domain S-box protein [Candidatus Peregrinibacteria bacterium]|jgi:PAS domain S-box-containing protein|nr:PAS domain S-box protein [Candidatus Peregrinibacteria bacterium]MBT4632390.1 PAS domain S-box protein [Candidatus Peregrinibacteria bacterium]MBT5517049.1 PAS domain S-box protein [Candidatus Peregrinibacteria bacterium]MBT5823594.1 PAS domain S-box protein [Candidatus Peregrinibacteria bacterium]